MYPIKKIRSDFPMLNNKNLIYLDNAATSYKPNCVINSELNIYKNFYASYKRGFYDSSIDITNKVEKARKCIANFINANYEEIIFTKGATESINLVANSFGKNLLYGDNIIISEIEHHSNFLPWKIIAKKLGIEIRILPININDGNFKIDILKKIIDKKTKLLTITHISNVLGILNPIEEIILISKKINKNIIIFLDGSQSIMKINIDVKKIDCDFYTFSSHKIYGPLGVGVLYGKNDLLNKMDPWEFGGSMVKYADFYKEKITYMDSPWKFEAGSINSPAIIGLESSIKYINKIGISKISEWEINLTKFTINILKKIKNIIIYGCSKNKIGIISFNIKNINNYDIGIMLNKENIYIRTGHHCSIPLMNIYNVNGMCRISFAMYTDYNDILFFIDKLKYIINLFQVK